MSKFVLSALIIIASTMSTGAHAATGNFTLYAGQSSGPYAAEIGYCQHGFCAYCDPAVPQGCEPVDDGFGALSNQFLSDSNVVMALSENQSTASPVSYITILYISASSDPGPNYLHTLSINCDGGAVQVALANRFYSSGLLQYSWSHATHCMSNSGTYNVTLN
jgi:hypothetical protein